MMVLEQGGIRRFFGLAERTDQTDTSYIISASLLLGILFWVIDSIIDSMIFYDDRSFLDLLALNIPPHDLYVRTFFILACLVGGLLASKLLRRQRESEAALREREGQLHAVLDNATIQIWAFDGEKYPYLNEEWYRYTGQDPTLPLTPERWIEAIHPDDLDEVVRTWHNAWNSKDAVDDYFRLRSAKGEYGIFYSHAVPVYDEKGKFKHYQGYNVDVTEREHAEDALKESEEKYRVLFETAKDAIFLNDETGKFVDVNSATCESLGYSKEELLKLNNREIDADPRGYEAFVKIRNGLMNEAVFEVNQRRKDGTLIPVEISGKKFEIGDSKLFLAIARDITERKQAEEQIKRSMREKEVLLQEIHHRVKNNLQVVSSLLDMQARAATDKDAIDILAEARDRVQTMSLIHSQLYGGSDLAAINMKEFVDRLLGQLFRSYPVEDVRITRVVQVDDYPFPISVAVPVGLIINELLSNVLKYAFCGRAEGRIEVRLTASEDGRINLTVSDDGVGLPPGFDIGATGTLGLCLVKILAKDQLQGNLEVISDGGATFKVEFDIRGNGGISYE